MKSNLIFEFSTVQWTGGILTEYLRNTLGILIYMKNNRTNMKNADCQKKTVRRNIHGILSEYLPNGHFDFYLFSLKVLTRCHILSSSLFLSLSPFLSRKEV